MKALLLLLLVSLVSTSALAVPCWVCNTPGPNYNHFDFNRNRDRSVRGSRQFCHHDEPRGFACTQTVCQQQDSSCPDLHQPEPRRPDFHFCDTHPRAPACDHSDPYCLSHHWEPGCANPDECVLHPLDPSCRPPH